MVDKMDHDHEEHEHEKDSFEPLKAEFYEGKHLSAPVKEIQVSIHIFASLTMTIKHFNLG